MHSTVIGRCFNSWKYTGIIGPTAISLDGSKWSVSVNEWYRSIRLFCFLILFFIPTFYFQIPVFISWNPSEMEEKKSHFDFSFSFDWILYFIIISILLLFFGNPCNVVCPVRILSFLFSIVECTVLSLLYFIQFPVSFLGSIWIFLCWW